MAVQLWQQVLLSEPNNAEALAGLARDYKLMGAADKSDEALGRLRREHPSDPNIAKIAAMTSTEGESSELRKAGELARQGKADEAIRIYRQLYGDHPPDSDVGMAYYQTLYATNTGKAAAVTGMRAMADRNPGSAPFAIALGTMLTYDARTRAEGIRILEAHPQDADAQAALRKALLWNAANPTSAAELRQYLKQHPQDTEVAGNLRTEESKLAQMQSGIARTPEERAAFAALNAHRLDDAQARFTALLEADPNNGRAAAGMGFLRMQQKNFGAAISFLSQAEQNGYKAKTIDTALATSRFWFTMSEAQQALDENDLVTATVKYRAALAVNARSADALNGLAGTLTREQQYPAAAEVYEELIKLEPSRPDGWRGLFLSYARDNRNQKALATTARFPAGVKSALTRDPEYLRTLAILYQAEGRSGDAERVLAQALTLPFPDSGSTLKADTKLQYAGILMAAKHYDQAAALYVQLVTDNPASVSAWMGLVSAHHEMGQDTLAIGDVEKMPPATYEASLADPGFLSMLGAIYQQGNQYEVAQGLLERSVKLQTAAGGQPTVALQLQLAGIYLLRNNTDQAYALYQQILQKDPNRIDAWRGLISTLQATNRNADALQEIAQIPAPVRKQLENDIEFEQTEAGLYAAAGDLAHATDYMNRVQAHYVKLKTLPPPSVDVENAWLLYNTGNDRALYLSLMRIGGRNDLTAAQRETVQDIWANWSVRRAAAAMDNGDVRRAVDILDAANQAFPDNLAVRKAVAGGYARIGRSREALKLFKTVPMQDASSGDFQGAIGAALAANDKTQAEVWLRQALERFTNDAAILGLAARYEQARGDNQRAADYWRASLAAMPAASPVDKLAHELDNPEQDTRAHRAVTAQDLHQLLDPDNEPFAKTTHVPPLPAYGPDPYNGQAPLVLAQPQPQSSNQQQRGVPYTAPAPSGAHYLAPDPSANRSNPAVTVIPSTQPPDQQLFHQQSFTISNAPVGSAIRNGMVMHDGVYHPPASGLVNGVLHGILHFKPEQGSGTHALAPRDAVYRSALTNAAGATLIQAQYSVGVQAVPITPNAPHSQASDAYKGLIFSLMSGNKNTEALDELAKIPPDVRHQLEADIEFVQGIASLYVAVGDSVHATDYLNRVEDYYLLHRSPAPAGLEVQHAWLLYNTKDDVGLYPVLLRLDARADLTPAQREQTQTLWANWAVRRADTAMETGHLLRGVELLQAASEDYPDDLTVRFAVAGAYARVGRYTEAVTLYKSIPMDGAASGDYQGAIGAALAATDMAQAEAWLRQALGKFGSDPQILALAARFEQARGNNQRAADFWRSALALMPPGSAIKSLDAGLAYPAGSYRTPMPGDTKRLLDPRNDPLPSGKLPPLPGYKPSTASQPPVSLSGPPPLTAPQRQWLNSPSSDPLPMPATSPHSSAPSNAPIYVPQSSNALPRPPRTNPAQPVQESRLRITARPTGAMAAQVQAEFAEQTDSQLTQGSIPVVHNLANAQGSLPANTQPATQKSVVTGQYNVAQYTPSAQEAATGAYSVPRQQAAPAQTEKPSAATPPPAVTAHVVRRRRKVKAVHRHAQATSASTSASTLGNTPALSNAHEVPSGSAQGTSVPYEAPSDAQANQPAPPPSSTGAGLSDEELQQRNLPPLRGPWVRVQRDQRPFNPREEAEAQLQSIESGYSGWLGGSGFINYRSGALGYDHLAALEAPFEASVPMGFHARFTIVAKPVFLDSGQADGSATITVLQSTTAGSALMVIPEPIGTLTNTANTPPAQQNAVGIGGEAQLAFAHAAFAGGYTPYGFLVSTFTARAFLRPGGGPISISLVRDPVKDSQLSYAGLRDPAGNSLGNAGQIWGGVIANQGNVQFSRGDAQSGFYVSAGGQYLTGYHVETNTRIDGNGGAYWRLLASPEYGNLSIGVNFFAMHYDHNENAFTHGMGGYFSPQGYFLGNVPFTFAGHYLTKWHYNIVGGLGVQAFQENKTPLFPLAADKSLETSQNNPMLPDVTSVGANYDVRGQVAYQISPHWFAGGFFGANNTRDYSSASAGFFVRFMFREQPSTATGPTGLFPTDGFRPFTVP
jgi:tetratricopeptide (TPR) repeat protein